MTKRLNGFLLTIVSLASLACESAAAESEREVLDGVAAVVNETVVLTSEFENEFQEVRNRLRRDGVELPPENVLREQVLESLISRKLQLNEAEQRGITIDDITLNEAVRDIATRNAGSLEQFRRQLETEGTSYAQFRTDIRHQLLLNRLKQQMVRSRVVLTEQEVDDYVTAQNTDDDNQYLLSHIQITVPEDADTEADKLARQKANSIYRQLIDDGADFSTLAVSESDGRKALEGGDLGWRKPSQLPREFAREVRNLTVGDISKPFSTGRGYHILKLHDTRGIERHFVRQVNARHILISPDELNDDDDVRIQLQEIRQKIIDGADFAKMAQEHSDDSGSAQQGGDLGWSDPEEYIPAVRDVMKDLPVGKISEPFKTRYGWHIVEVLGWRRHDNTVEFQRSRARQTLYERKARLEEELWLQQLRDEAYVDIRVKF